MKDLEAVKTELRDLLAGQLLAVLATQGQQGPYASLVAFSFSDDLRALFFATSRSTRKFANISRNSRVALLIDSRTNSTDDFHTASGATAVGSAEELSGAERNRALTPYLSRHPQLSDFVSSPTCSFIRVSVRTYYVVKRFQNVQELHITP